MLKALTVRVPWSFGISHGRKSPENRSKETRFRGELAIHAGARSRWDPAGPESPLLLLAWARHLVALGWAPESTDYPQLRRSTGLVTFSAIVAVADLSDCHHAESCARAGRLCTPWAARGQWHWELSRVRPLASPIPCDGQLGFWTVPQEAEAAVRAQLADGRD